MVTANATDQSTTASTCHVHGGMLATIYSSEQNAALVNAFSSQVTSPLATTTSNAFWIGFERESTKRPFTWLEGSASAYTNWDAGQPDNCGGYDDCSIVQISNGKWGNVACSLSTDFCNGQGRFGSYQGLCKLGNVYLR